MSHILQLPRGLSLPTLDPAVVLWMMCDPPAQLELFKAASSDLALLGGASCPSLMVVRGCREQVGSHLDLLEPRGKTFH